jgi:hypothetical protein
MGVSEVTFPRKHAYLGVTAEIRLNTAISQTFF